MPAPVVSGFLGCIGYKVLKYAIKVSVGHVWYHPETSHFWGFVASPAIPIGLPLYVLKRKHIGNPMIILPAFLIVPTALFFISVAASGASLSSLRSYEWMFPDEPSAPFYSIWTELKWGKISWKTIPACLPDMFIMVIILVIDSLLKLTATKTKLKVFLLNLFVVLCFDCSPSTIFLFPSPLFKLNTSSHTSFQRHQLGSSD